MRFGVKGVFTPCQWTCLVRLEKKYTEEIVKQLNAAVNGHQTVKLEAGRQAGIFMGFHAAQEFQCILLTYIKKTV